MKKWTWRIVGFLVVAFAIFYIYTRPEAAADFVKAVFGIFDALGVFFNSLASP